MKSFSTVVAGLALASSWTWVIGMYLPRVLLERYGWLGLVIFAVPNVLGCAAFGRVLGKEGASDALRKRVSQEARWFSSATIAFHLLFTVFLMKSLLPEDGVETIWEEAFLAPIVLLVIAFAMSLMSKKFFLWSGALIWCFSMGVLATYVERTIEITPTEPPLMSLFLLPLTAAGFLLCPYLDLTFHEVRRHHAQQAFDIFGVAFSCMLCLSVMMWMSPAPHLNPYVRLHLCLQSLFTVAWHLGALGREESESCDETYRGVVPKEREHHGLVMFINRGFVIPLVVAMGAFFIMSGDRQTDQAWYLRFLFLYGGLFPAAFLMRLKYGTKNTLPALAFFALITAIPGELSFIRFQPAWALVPFMALIFCVPFRELSTSLTTSK